MDNRHTGYLQPWAAQGVLLLNAVLTVEAGSANAHQGKGWEMFTDKIIEVINAKCENVVFILWGVITSYSIHYTKLYESVDNLI